MAERKRHHTHFRFYCKRIKNPWLRNTSCRIFREALSEEAAGVIVNGEVINNLHFANDTVLTASSQQDLQDILNKVMEKCAMAGLELNIKNTNLNKKRTEVLVVSR